MDMGIMLVLLGIIICAGNVFLYCYVGSFTTENFLQYANVSYESPWYKIPINLQQYLRLIIADAQRPQIFDGLGIFELNLMLFTKVNFDI